MYTEVADPTSPTRTNTGYYTYGYEVSAPPIFGNVGPSTYPSVRYSQEVGATCVTLDGMQVATGYLNDRQPSSTYTVNAMDTCSVDGNTPFRFVGYSTGGTGGNEVTAVNKDGTTYITMPGDATVGLLYRRERPTVTLYDVYGEASSYRSGAGGSAGDNTCGYGTYTTKIAYGTGSYQYGDLASGLSKYNIDGSNPADGSIAETETYDTATQSTTYTYTYDNHYYFSCVGLGHSFDGGASLFPQFSSWNVQKSGGGINQPQPTGPLIITSSSAGIKSNITATAIWGPVYVPYAVDLSNYQCVYGDPYGLGLAGNSVAQFGIAAADTTITSSTLPQSCHFLSSAGEFYYSSPGWESDGYYTPTGYSFNDYMACVNPATMTLVANFASASLDFIADPAYQYLTYPVYGYNNYPLKTCSHLVTPKPDLPPQSS